MAEPSLIRSDVVPIGWQHNLVTSAHLSSLVDTNCRSLQLLGVVFLRLRLVNFHSRAQLIVTKHLSGSIIIVTEILDRHVRAIGCVEGIFEIILGTVRMRGGNKSNGDAAESKVSTPIQLIDSTTDADKASLERSSISVAQTIHVLEITQISVMVRCLFPGLIHIEQKHAVFIIRLLLLTNGVVNRLGQTIHCRSGQLLQCTSDGTKAHDA